MAQGAAMAALALVAAAVVAWRLMIWMPGRSHRGALPPLSDGQRHLAASLRGHVEALAGGIGERNVGRPAALRQAADLLEGELRAMGWAPARDGYVVGAVHCDNIVVELRGGARADEIVVVGGHYDSVSGCPGANDNATGVAALLELARRARAEAPPQRTVRYVLFVNEEPPHFESGTMGSMVYARRCRERGEGIVAMLSLETMGCYSDARGSQQYPFPFSLMYPSTGDFIGFVGDVGSRRLVRDAIRSFRAHASFPSEGVAAPGSIDGIGWSDHWSFWQAGYPGVMVTDTAPFRYASYHQADDTPEKVDYDRLARVVDGLAAVVADLARAR